MAASYLPLAQAAASGLWHALKAGKPVHTWGLTAPVYAVAVKRHPYDNWSPVTADPGVYPSTVRFAAVVK